jgi:poly(beta-D-mannuronate) C5 epimerase
VRGFRRLLAAAVTGLVVCGWAVLAAASAASASADPDPAAQRCQLSATLDPTYSGTSDERDLKALPVDPYKLVNYPCAFPPDVRGIRLDAPRPFAATVSLVQGGALVRSYTVPADAAGAVRLEAIAAVIDDPAWIAMPLPGVVALAAPLVQSDGTSLIVAQPAVTQVRLLGNPNVSMTGTDATVTFTGVTVTSWDPVAGAPMPDPVYDRPFVVYKNGGRIDATDSTFQNLGSDASSGYGVSWRLGTTGTVTGSTFQNSFFGAYTYQTSDIVWERCIFRDNTWYGLDPHTDSTRLTVRDNEAYGNGHHGIVFSQYVTDSLVEGNYVHDNKVNGIMMDFRSTGNTIRGNVVADNGQGIVLTGSGSNQVYGNTLTGNGVGVRASHDGADANVIRDNAISGGRIGVDLYGGASTTTIAGNVISGTSRYGIDIDAPRSATSGNTISASPIGIRIETVATMSGDRISARDTAIDLEQDAYARIAAVTVVSGAPLAVAAGATAQLSQTAFGLPRSDQSDSSLSLLDEIGISIIAFALLCEMIHLTRGFAMRRFVGARQGMLAFSGVPHGVLGGSQRLLVRPPQRGRTAPGAVIAPIAPGIGAGGAAAAPAPPGEVRAPGASGRAPSAHAATRAPRRWLRWWAAAGLVLIVYVASIVGLSYWNGSRASGPSAAVAVAAPGVAAAGGTAAGGTATVTITGGSLDLTGLRRELSARGQSALLAPTSSGALLLTADLIVGHGGSLNVDVPMFQLQSDPERSVTVRVQSGGLLSATKTSIVSWDGTGPDVVLADGRASIEASGAGSRIDIERSSVSYLGADADDPGLSWRDGAAGSIIDSTLSHSYRGADASKSGGLAVTGSTFADNAENGLSLRTPGSGSRVAASTFQANGADGLFVSKATGIALDGNLASANGGAGVAVSGGSGTLVNDLRSHDNAAEGVLLSDATAAVVSRANAWSNATGISISGGSATIQDSELSGNVGDGVLVGNSGASATITGNRVDHNGRSGIWLAGAISATITSNVIDRNDTGVRIDDQALAVVARGNMVTASVLDGFALSLAANPGVGGNTIAGSGQAALSLPAPGDVSGVAAVNTLTGKQKLFRVRGEDPSS